MDNNTRTQFWRLPSSIRHTYNERDVREVVITELGTKAVVLVQSVDGADSWMLTDSQHDTKVCWRKRRM